MPFTRVRQLSTAVATVLLLTQALPLARAERKVRSTATTSVSRDVKVQQNVNVQRNTNVNVHKDVHVDVDVHHGCCYRPVAPVAAAVVTAAVIGSVVYALPPACTTVVVGAVSYHQCGSVWYQPRFAGTSVTYVVVSAPR